MSSHSKWRKMNYYGTIQNVVLEVNSVTSGYLGPGPFLSPGNLIITGRKRFILTSNEVQLACLHDTFTVLLSIPDVSFKSFENYAVKLSDKQTKRTSLEDRTHPAFLCFRKILI